MLRIAQLGVTKSSHQLLPEVSCLLLAQWSITISSKLAKLGSLEIRRAVRSLLERDRRYISERFFVELVDILPELADLVAYVV